MYVCVKEKSVKFAEGKFSKEIELKWMENSLYTIGIKPIKEKITESMLIL